ncbi:SAM-dependent methyltransferase [Plastoroseomonas arctica]|uniref:Class I SAM-dependent methyltransferase n=1 Tax=Plastoroseomonas arctica TaxID=1509237 RepID=A0AAF1KKE5_9PROT|nr:cyclopropane-fatty-acyl-phospholipid synthase family protein [Plastoroseomonas arctica]MBR0656430.1 class I SAM-dependent methyltransferase [Plastoroseomonas arctica]
MPDLRLARLAALIAELAPHLAMDVAVKLWDGVPIPLGPRWSGDLAVAVHAPEAITRLLRRPRLTTLIELFAEGLIAIEGGTLLDLAARRGEGRGTRGLLRRVGKLRAARTLLPFLFGGGTAGAGHAYAGPSAERREGGRDDKALVQFHYDLANAFYALFLDPEMVYSCAYFPDWEASLGDAQVAKLEHVCRKLRLTPGERFLDIGCGWGGLVCHAAQHHGVTAHGVTLSQAQYDFAVAKVARLGLQGRVTIELKDFSKLSGEWDKIASVGMYEHVGLANRAGYFAQIRALLRPRGIYLHHAITRPAKRDARAFSRKRPEYAAVVNYVFPGSELDHIGNTVQDLERGGFEVHDVESLREHYGRTCRLWTERLYAARETAEAEVGAAKTRIWLLYLAGVALGFERGTIGICQTVATKRARGASGLPPTRADLYR